MEKYKLNLDIFMDYDKYGEGTIRNRDFDRVLVNELKINIEDHKYDRFASFLKDPSDENYYSISKIKVGIENDKKAEEWVNNINMDIRYGDFNVEQIFKKYDRNRNVRLEREEFKRFI